MKKEIFNKGVEELLLTFPKMEINEKQAEVWYKYSKDISDSLWEKKITNCIKGCRKIPTLADVLDIKGYYVDNTKEYKYFEPEEDEYEYKPMPDHIRKEMDELNEKITMPTGKPKLKEGKL